MDFSPILPDAARPGLTMDAERRETLDTAVADLLALLPGWERAGARGKRTIADGLRYAAAEIERAARDEDFAAMARMAREGTG